MDTNVKKPEVSVVMAVYNGEKYLREAIGSILSQTFSDFEFIIIDDGSTDKTAEIIQSSKDPRIVYVSNDTNKGLSYSLNRGLDLAKGEFVARMDADDMSLPERLERQVDFMKQHPDIAVCGSFVKTFGENRKEFVHTYWTSSEDLRASLLWNTSLAHPSVIMRISALNVHHLHYDENDLHFEDYALWVKMAKYANIANLPEVLLLYRMHTKSVSSSNTSRQKEGASSVRRVQLEKLGLNPRDEDMRIHNSLRPNDGESVMDFLNKEENWLLKIKNANTEKNIYKPESLGRVAAARWYLLCSSNAKHVNVWRKFKNSELSSGKFFENLKLFLKCLLQK